MSINSGLFDAIDLAKYLNFLHKKKYNNKSISPLKLQKVLFFLFGEWGGFVSKDVSADNDGKELNNYSKLLFSDAIEAWVYGPVIKKVYEEFEQSTKTYKELFISDEEQYVGNFIKDLALELFELSDFRLVEISHQSEEWNKKFVKEEIFHNNVMNQDDIINEFI